MMRLWRWWQARRHQRAVNAWVESVHDRVRRADDPIEHADVLKLARLRMEAEDDERDRRSRPRRRARQREPWAFYGPPS